MIVWLLALGLAHAEAPGHYHPNGVSQHSAQFKRAQAVAGKAFQARQDEAEALAAALNAYEEALDLLGDQAPQAERDRHAALTQTFQRELAVLQAFAQEQLDGMDQVFSSGLERARKGHMSAVRCEQAQRSTFRMGPGGRGAQGEACPGTDLNSIIAHRMDEDATLKTELDALLAVSWPSFTRNATPQVPVGGADATLDLRAALRSQASDALRAIDFADEEARLGFQAAIEDGATPEQLEALVGQARAVTATTASRRAALAAPVVSTVDALADKLAKKGPDVGWCSQPRIYGGCTAPPVDLASHAKLWEHPKTKKALAEASAYRP